MIGTITGIALLILVAVVVLSILILSHELGHFLMAKKMGVFVEEFGLGLPPRLFGKKIGETIYSINALPIGGFVRLHGETGDSKITDKERAFVNKSKLARIAIASAGILANFLLAVFAFSIFYSFQGIPREGKDVKVLEVASESPAQVAEMLVEDVIRKVNDEEITSTEKFIELIEENKGKRTVLEIERIELDQTVTKKITLTPRAEPPENQGSLGVVVSATEIYFPPIWQRPFVGIYFGIKQSLMFSGAVVAGLFGIARDVGQGKPVSGVAGPAGIVALIGYVSRLGIMPLINFVGLISINLAVLNLVPFPPLDGARVLFVVAEAVLGKKMVPKVEGIVHTVGMIIILALLLFVTVKEIPRIISAGSLASFVEGFLAP